MALHRLVLGRKVRAHQYTIEVIPISYTLSHAHKTFSDICYRYQSPRIAPLRESSDIIALLFGPSHVDQWESIPDTLHATPGTKLPLAHGMKGRTKNSLAMLCLFHEISYTASVYHA